MALTEDTLVYVYGNDLIKFSNAAAEGTYYVGEKVMHDPADGYVKPVSGSDVADVTTAGVVLKQQTVSAGEKIEFYKGTFALSGALAGAAHNALVHFGDNEVVTLTAGDTVFGGRFKGQVSDNGERQWAVEIGHVPSGSAS